MTFCVITYFNEHAAMIWGKDSVPDGALWQFLESRRFFSSDGKQLARIPTREAIETGNPILNRELLLARADGSTVNVLMNVTPLRSTGGGVSGAVAVVQNVTELKKAQLEREVLLKELQRSNREPAAFSYSVADDLQAPVRRAHQQLG